MIEQIENDKLSQNLAAEQFLTKVRWPDGIRCARCKSDQISNLGMKRPDRGGLTIYMCRGCGCHFSVLTYTSIHGCAQALHQWVTGTIMVCQNPNISAYKLAQDMAVGMKKRINPATAIRIVKTIRPLLMGLDYDDPNLVHKVFRRLMETSDERLIPPKSLKETIRLQSNHVTKCFSLETDVANELERRGGNQSEFVNKVLRYELGLVNRPTFISPSEVVEQ